MLAGEVLIVDKVDTKTQDLPCGRTSREGEVGNFCAETV